MRYKSHKFSNIHGESLNVYPYGKCKQTRITQEQTAHIGNVYLQIEVNLIQISHPSATQKADWEVISHHDQARA